MSGTQSVESITSPFLEPFSVSELVIPRDVQDSGSPKGVGKNGCWFSAWMVEQGSLSKKIALRTLKIGFLNC